jgi:plasmid stabilization system protein ParE
MALRISWSEFAKKQLYKIFNYYKKRVNLSIAQKIVSGITESVSELSFQTKIGQHEELLKERSQEFRYLVYKNYKIIYWIDLDTNQIIIADVFDTRQNPQKIKRI